MPSSELVLGESEARDGQTVLAEHFPGGSGSPAQIITPEAELETTATIVAAHPGVESMTIVTEDAPGGQAPVSVDTSVDPSAIEITAFGPPGTRAPSPTVVDDAVLLFVTLTDTADSEAAQETVRDLRAELNTELGTGVALVGGETATDVDSVDTSSRDRALIIPLILVVVFLILVVLCRALVMPILLMLTVVLSFATALGVSAVMFNHVFNFPGADPSVPLYGFIFLVALGIDYNIFLISRVREETVDHGTHQGILRGLVSTGGVITSAGLVLAATFAALGVIPILFLAQIAFLVAFGVLLDTLLVRSLLVPALAYDIGANVWWPSRLAQEPRTSGQQAAGADPHP